MTDSEKALALLKAKYGEFDNIKLMLGNGSDMTVESVGTEFLGIAQAISDDRIGASSSFDESLLDDARIVIA